MRSCQALRPARSAATRLSARTLPARLVSASHRGDVEEFIAVEGWGDKFRSGRPRGVPATAGCARLNGSDNGYLEFTGRGRYRLRQPA